MKRKHQTLCILIFLVSLLAIPFSVLARASTITPPASDLGHLLQLRDSFDVEGSEQVGYWIYADFKGGRYVPVGATGEGVSCVDDVARAGLVFLDRFEQTGEPVYAQLAIEAVEFCLALQSPSGDFWNFLFEDGTINRHGITSRLSADWWALRALWLIGRASNVFAQQEPERAASWFERTRSTVNLLATQLDYQGLIRGYTDLTSLWIIVLAQRETYRPDEQNRRWIQAASEGLLAKQQNQGLFTGWIDEGREEFAFHGWGSRQIQALCDAHAILGEEKYREAASRMALSLAPWMITRGPFYAVSPTHFSTYPQISYAAECLVTGLVRLYEQTGQNRFAQLAALAMGFFYGNNPLQRPMVGPNGEGYDGMESAFINRNSGAESTICFLLAKNAVQKLPAQAQELQTAQVLHSVGPIVLEAEKQNTGLSDTRDVFVRGQEALEGEYIQFRVAQDRLETHFLPAFSGQFPASTTARVSRGDNLSETQITTPLEGFLLLPAFPPDPVENEKVGRLLFSLRAPSALRVDQFLLVPTVFGQFVQLGESQLFWGWNSSSSSATLFSGGMQLDFQPQEWKLLPVDSLDLPTSQPVLETNQVAVSLVPTQQGAELLDLRPLFNNDGIGTLRGGANFDNPSGTRGAYYPVELVQELPLAAGGISFSIAENEEGMDNMVLQSQHVQINQPLSPREIWILGSCDHGSYSGWIDLGFADGSVASLPVAFSDWCGPSEMGEEGFFPMDYRYNSAGDKEWISPKLFWIKRELPGKPLESIRFPSIPTMHVFAVAFTE
ncbi:MAG TPA: hypothetical protein PLF96_02470 [Thermotogota bacterium]|nr:hypothetical protein [Thermotogota bacterium]